MPRVKAMLEAGPLDGAAIGEAVEAEVGVEGDASIVSVSVAISPANSSCFAEWSCRGLGRSSLSCSCVGCCTVAFIFPGRSRGCWRSTSHRG